jgi:hypothetical protein
MNIWSRVSCALAILCLSATAGAQDGQWGQGFKGEFKPVIGAWAQYRISGGKAAGTTMKMAVVGREDSSYWYETTTQGQGETIVMKMLVSGDPNDMRAVKRVIVKHGDGQPMEMPAAGRDGRSGKTPVKKGRVLDKGMETIKVPAGTFGTRHIQYVSEEGTVDTWTSDKVPPYCIVKSASKGFEMVLTGYGMGARTSVTGTPRRFQMPKMPQGMPKGMRSPEMAPPED